jgi:hypothetical protein
MSHTPKTFRSLLAIIADCDDKRLMFGIFPILCIISQARFVRAGNRLYAAQPDFDNPIMDRAAIEELVAKFPLDKQDFERERRLQALEEW